MLCVYSFTRSRYIPYSLLSKRLGRGHLYNAFTSLSEGCFTELVSFLDKGPCEDIVLLRTAIDSILTEYYVWMTPCSLSLDGQEHIPVAVTEPKIRLRCSDGVKIERTRVLCDIFTLIRDFSAEYPGEEIPVPYESGTVQLALSPLLYARTAQNTASLRNCLSCVKHLNPITDLYYLAFSLEGMDPEEVRALSLTQQDRAFLRETYTYDCDEWSVPLSHGGEGHYILVTSGSVRADRALRAALFSDCPSLLAYLDITTRDPKCESPIPRLLTTDFSKDCSYVPYIHSVRMADCICGLMIASHKRGELTWDDAKKLLAMMGLRHTYLDNENVELILPYGAYLSPIELQRSLCDLGETLAGIYPGEWDEETYQSIFCS